MVDLIDHAASLQGGEEVELLGAGDLEVVASEVLAVVAVVGEVVPEDVPAGPPDGAVQLDVERLGGLVRDDSDDVAGLDPLPPPRAKLTITSA